MFGLSYHHTPLMQLVGDTAIAHQRILSHDGLSFVEAGGLKDQHAPPSLLPVASLSLMAQGIQVLDIIDMCRDVVIKDGFVYDPLFDLGVPGQ